MAEKSVIIIGAGLAGLSAGCYGQMNGYRTRIYEMHDKPGGLCTAWVRKGYTFDGCIHWLMGSRSGLTHHFYEELGAVQGRRMVDHEEFMRIEGREGETWIIYPDLDRLEQHMVELSPADAGVIRELCNAARLFGRYEMPVEKPAELMGVLDRLKMLRLMPFLRAMLKYGQVSTQEYAARFRDPFLREVFPLMLDDLPGMSLIGVLFFLASLHANNAGWPTGGSLAFARAIERRYLDLGGEVQYRARVEKVLVEGDRAVGVRLADGTEHRADRVISAADGRTTIYDMLEGRSVDDTIRSTYDEWPIYQPIIQVSLGVARDFSGEPRSVLYPLEEPIAVGGEARHWLHVYHYCFDPSMAPPNKSVVTVVFLNNDHAYWAELYADRERYRAAKQALADAVIDRLEARYPGIREQIEVVDVATPVTYERYTGNWQGSYMGWASTTETADKTMSRTLPGLGGFYMAGQWVYMGGGVPGAVMSGRHLMQMICREDKRPFVTTVP